ALVGVAINRFGSVENALAYLNGQRVFSRPSVVDLGTGRAGELVERSVEIFNQTDRPLRVVGGTSDCSCLTTSDLPVTIPAGESRTVAVKVKLPPGEGVFQRRVQFWTDADGLQPVHFGLTGRITSPTLGSARQTR